MILQPLVENSIKHGLSRKVGPGVITMRSRRDGGRAIIEVEDDGMGFVLDRLDQPMSSGIGLANVRERLRVIYGATYQLTLDSNPGQGTMRAHRSARMLDGAGADHRRMTEHSASSSSTTSSWRARSCATSSSRPATSRSSPRPATGSRR